MRHRQSLIREWLGGEALVFTVVPIVFLLHVRAPAWIAHQEAPATLSQDAASEGPTSAPVNATEPGSAVLVNESDETCETLAAAAASASGKLEACRAYLAAARCTLVNECAVPLSAELAGSDGSRKVLGARASAASSFLDRATASLREAEVDDAAMRDLGDRIDMLRAFGEVFEAIALADTSKESGKRLLAAGNELAVYLDDSNEAVVESAKLWVGHAYRRAGRPERSLQVLRPIITAPVSCRVGFWGRIERCRALGETDHHAAGIALSQRLGARVGAWFAEEDGATRERAAAMVRFVRAQLLRGWADKLRADGETDRADEALSEAKKLVDADAVTPPPERWLSLTESIAGLSDWDIEPTSAPADEADAGE